MEQNLLFGVDDSDFSMQSVAAVGNLVKKSKNLKITLFHGVRDPNISLLSKALRLSTEALEQYRELSVLEERKVLDQAREVLLASGVGADKVAIILAENCHDVAECMLKSATSEGFETLALA